MTNGGTVAWFSSSRYAQIGFASWRWRFSGICLRVGFKGVARFAEVRTGLDEKIGWATQGRGSIATSILEFMGLSAEVVGLLWLAFSSMGNLFNRSM
jgi:hypothetical protein